MAAHRRPLVTSAVAGGLLCALWFVPSANATDEAERAPSPPAPAPVAAAGPGHSAHSPADPAAVTARADGSGPLLADTGGFDTVPYLTGGVAFLVAGTGLVARSVRRSRPTA
ncbi:hypothetical protein V1J52_06515 [Streptomyces sp. TRM 70351]|uniref:hypothetical protein n=1 Tax=Streptomyces sp. TRM 70351 TaxID=3116552 RepID=UPI002E7AFEA6|nr:hypothetical protein [Streptomyces sp. TRM 70351]MEE1927846.1 hypothetical protein [Streptomyces sp. TRM 70351]